MKCRFTVKSGKQATAAHQNGIALVITLVMLAIVTVMAIVFLAVTRRERSSVKVTEETAIAKDMADAALEQVKSKALANMNATGARLHYELFNSQAFYNSAGFDPSKPATNSNVAPVWDWPRIHASRERDYLELLGNLQHDPAVPVFVETNRNGRGDLRYYLDFNRNRQFETNGLLYDYDFNYQPIVERDINNNPVTNRYRFVGDPEWIGVLERPDFPHSETNRFVGRFAYLTLPAGKTLDLNFIHNQVNPSDRLDQTAAQNGFSRSQGVGSWEINLAAFLRELNGNPYAWRPDTYQFELRPDLTFDANGAAFNNARELLAFRFKQRGDLKSVYESLGPDNMLNPVTTPASFGYVRGNLVEDFGNRATLPSDSRVFFAANVRPNDDDNESVRGWPGSINTNAFTDLQQLFSVDATSADFVARLQRPALLAADGGSGQSGKSSYDRYTLYRLASQLGTDSTPAIDGKIHLNFKNPVGQLTNVTERWFENPTNASMFFTNAADLMLRASIDGAITISNNLQVTTYRRPMGTYYIIGDTLVRTNFSMTNILFFSTNLLPGVVINEYTPTVHRILQVAANIYDAMTNRTASLPSVFTPVFTNVNNNLYIYRYQELSNNAANYINNRTWITPEAAVNPGFDASRLPFFNIYGQHLVIGAKKGHPNFNELALKSQIEFSRKIMLVKDNPSSTNIVTTNQMFLVDLHQRWGMEGWNSYVATNNRATTIKGQVLSTVALRDGTNLAFNPVFMTNLTFSRTTNLSSWQGRRRVQMASRDPSFLVVMDQTVPLIGNRSYSSQNDTIPRGPGRFRGTNDYSATLDLPPEFILYTTNQVSYWVTDDQTGRIVDFISFERLVTETDTREKLRPPNNLALGTNVNTVNYWDTNRIGGGPLTVGVSNQLAVSVGNLVEPRWENYRWASDREAGISKFRVFLGLPGRTGVDTNITSLGLRQQAPFTPTRHVVHSLSWQVNDPLVHYMIGDLRRDRVNEGPNSFDAQVPNDTNWNIGDLNRRIYHPWGKDDPNDPYKWNYALMDPGIRSSDDWEFLPGPGLTNNHFPNIGTLGQIHRGTPWQTLYLKSFYERVDGTNRFLAHPSLWYNWAGSVGTHPMRDWRLLDVFTTAANENAARGLLSVNQTNAAAWSAVLSGTIAARNFARPPLAARNTGVKKEDAYEPRVIEPATPEIDAIVRNINGARTNQYDIIPNPDANSNRNMPFVPILRTNSLAGKPADVFRSMGDVLSAPALTVQSPFLKSDTLQVQAVWNDRAVEYIPQQILSLLQRDEPRFVVYAFGQSLKPAPRSLTTDPNFYHMCTNYQITGEVITKTTFRVEGRPRDPADPLRPVVEKYEVLPPWE